MSANPEVVRCALAGAFPKSSVRALSLNDVSNPLQGVWIVKTGSPEDHVSASASNHYFFGPIRSSTAQLQIVDPIEAIEDGWSEETLDWIFSEPSLTVEGFSHAFRRR